MNLQHLENSRIERQVVRVHFPATVVPFLASQTDARNIRRKQPGSPEHRGCPCHFLRRLSQRQHCRAAKASMMVEHRLSKEVEQCNASFGLFQTNSSMYCTYAKIRRGYSTVQFPRERPRQTGQTTNDKRGQRPTKT